MAIEHREHYYYVEILALDSWVRVRVRQLSKEPTCGKVDSIDLMHRM